MKPKLAWSLYGLFLVAVFTAVFSIPDTLASARKLKDQRRYREALRMLKDMPIDNEVENLKIAILVGLLDAEDENDLQTVVAEKTITLREIAAVKEPLVEAWRSTKGSSFLTAKSADSMKRYYLLVKYFFPSEKTYVAHCYIRALLSKAQYESGQGRRALVIQAQRILQENNISETDATYVAIEELRKNT